MFIKITQWKIWRLRAVLWGTLVLVIGLLGWVSNYRALPANGAVLPPAVAGVWGHKPVLEYFFINQELAGLAAQELDLSTADLAVIEGLARLEGERLRALEAASEVIIADAQLSLQDKRIALQARGYQTQFEQTLAEQQLALQQVLDEAVYARLVEWIESRWLVERALHGSASLVDQQIKATRTYTVYAARYDAGGAYTVALPDQCVKFANNGIASLTKCANYGYEDGVNYSVSISYQGRSVSVRPQEAGPWNVDDTFWATISDPTPRRMFTDLALGVPQAQAAYFDNYNGGLDQFGRKVKQPFGIDLSFEVAADLGIQANAWVDVTFMWTADWEAADPGSGEAAVGVPQVIIPVATATADAEGRLLHEVQPGQTLWAIALAYEVTIDDLEAWNNLSRQDSLLIGERLIIPDSSAKSLGTPTPVGMIQADDGRVFHLVQPDENLSMIVERYGVELGDILALNEIQADWPLQIGQQLLVRTADGMSLRPLTAVEKLTPASDGRYYHTITEGESLSSIADLYEISVAELMTWNELGEAAVIQPGEKLLLEVTPPATQTATPAPVTATPVATRTATTTPTQTLEPVSPLASPTAALDNGTSAGSKNWALWGTVILALGGGLLLLLKWLRRAGKV
jgi:LysM repeat protein